MEKQGNRKRRIVLVPFPFQGHITPMLQLGNALLRKGFTITIVHTKFNAPDPSAHPDFDFHPISDNLSTRDIKTEIFAFLEKFKINCELPLKEELTKMMEQEQEETYGQLVGVVYDALVHFAEAAANHLNIPSAVFRSSSPSYLVAYQAMPRLQAEGHFPIQDSMWQDLVPGLHPLRFKDLPFSNEMLQQSLKFAHITSNIRSSSAIIWNTMDYLEQESLLKLQQHYKVPFFTVGPLQKMAQLSSTSLLEEDFSCMEWLDKQATKSVIYVSFGSVASMEANELAEAAWGLANSGQPFLWVIRPGLVRGSEWIELLPKGFNEKVGERGLIVKWAPQKEVLAHGAVGGFWSHCGWNSTLESICEGVPMICRPQFVDQTVNARYLSYVWRVGVELEYELERGDIERAIRRVFVDKEGVEIRQRTVEMKEKVNACICEGGSSYNSLNELAEFFSSHSVRQNKSNDITNNKSTHNDVTSDMSKYN